MPRTRRAPNAREGSNVGTKADIRGLERTATTVTATVDGVPVPATTPFVLGQYAGLEQVNLGPFPRSLQRHPGEYCSDPIAIAAAKEMRLNSGKRSEGTLGQ